MSNNPYYPRGIDPAADGSYSNPLHPIHPPAPAASHDQANSNSTSPSSVPIPNFARPYRYAEPAPPALAPSQSTPRLQIQPGAQPSSSYGPQQRSPTSPSSRQDGPPSDTYPPPPQANPFAGPYGQAAPPSRPYPPTGPGPYAHRPPGTGHPGPPPQMASYGDGGRGYAGDLDAAGMTRAGDGGPGGDLGYRPTARFQDGGAPRMPPAEGRDDDDDDDETTRGSRSRSGAKRRTYFHPDEKIDPDSLTPEQKQVAEMFPKDLDDEEGGMWKTIKNMDYKQYISWKYTHWYIIFILLAVAVALLVVYKDQIVTKLTPISKKIRSWSWGFVIPIGIMFVLSFPPLFGQEIIIILCGVVYGLWIGFGVAAAGTFVGEVGNFIAFKYCLQRMAEKYERRNMEYGCLAHIVREMGFKIVFLVRLSVLPGHFTTAVFSTVGVSFWVFCIAAILTLPKQLVIVYLGVAFEESGSGTATKQSKIVEYAVLALTGIMSFGVLIYINKKMRQARPIVQARLKQRRATMLTELANSNMSAVIVDDQDHTPPPTHSARWSGGRWFQSKAGGRPDEEDTVILTGATPMHRVNSSESALYPDRGPEDGSLNPSGFHYEHNTDLGSVYEYQSASPQDHEGRMPRLSPSGTMAAKAARQPPASYMASSESLGYVDGGGSGLGQGPLTTTARLEHAGPMRSELSIDIPNAPRAAQHGSPVGPDRLSPVRRQASPQFHLPDPHRQAPLPNPYDDPAPSSTDHHPLSLGVDQPPATTTIRAVQSSDRVFSPAPSYHTHAADVPPYDGAQTGRPLVPLGGPFPLHPLQTAGSHVLQPEEIAIPGPGFSPGPPQGHPATGVYSSPFPQPQGQVPANVVRYDLHDG